MPITDVTWVSHDDPNLAETAARMSRDEALDLAATWMSEAQRYFQVAKGLEAQLRVLAAQHSAQHGAKDNGTGALLLFGALVLLGKNKR